MRKPGWLVSTIITVAAAALATTLVAQGLPRLPQDYALPQGDGSPGKVTFSHQTHVDQSRPDCTVCHPKLFRMLKKGTPTDGGPIVHAKMEKGRQCGSCHNGKDAHGFDDCTTCHRGQ